MNKRVPHWPQKNRGFLFKVHAFDYGDMIRNTLSTESIVGSQNMLCVSCPRNPLIVGRRESLNPMGR
jgi:hypothetical protein